MLTHLEPPPQTGLVIGWCSQSPKLYAKLTEQRMCGWGTEVCAKALSQGCCGLLWKEQGVGLWWSTAPAPTTAPFPGDMFSKKAGQLSTIFSWLTNTSFFKTVSNSTPPSLWSSDITTLSQGRQTPIIRILLILCYTFTWELGETSVSLPTSANDFLVIWEIPKDGIISYILISISEGDIFLCR